MSKHLTVERSLVSAAPSQDDLAAIIAGIGVLSGQQLAARLVQKLPDIAAEDSARAGRALKRAGAGAFGGRKIEATLLASSTLMHFEDHLRCALAGRGVALSLTDTGYNQWRLFLQAQHFAPVGEDRKIALLVLDDGVIFDALDEHGNLDAIEAKTREMLDEMRNLLDRNFAASATMLVMNTPVLTRHNADLFTDQTSRSGIAAIWHRFEAALLDLARDYPMLRVCDSATLLQDRVTHARLTDPRLRSLAREAWSAQAQMALAAGFAQVIASQFAETRKCLLVDFDNTLWNGAVGDIGPHDIEIEDGDHGDSHLRLQKTVRALARQGVILCGVTKNHEHVVEEAFAQRQMPLKWTDFALVKANWEPKSVNIRAIAEALNVGVDSMVLVDDSGLECAEVSANVPEVLCVHLRDAFEFSRAILAPAFFEKAAVTGDDRERNARYRSEALRKEAKVRHGSHDGSFLYEIGLRAQISPVGETLMSRVAQLSQRTNQFNMTQLRWDLASLRELIGSPFGRVYSLRLEDKFGDYGLVGAVFASIKGEEAVIENAVLSCRVFGRGAEHFMLVSVIGRLFEAGAGRVRATFKSSPKNGQFSNFFAEIGGEPGKSTPGDHNVEYVFTKDGLAAGPDWISGGSSGDSR